jgi:hypothetical protein
MRQRGFRYVTDPICIACLLLYPLNRWYLKPHRIGGHFTVAFLNDTICLPLFLPMILYLQRRLGVRRHDGPPRLWEVLQHWAIFSVVFKAIMPRFPQVFRTSGDPWDMLAYIGGGLIAWAIWNWPIGKYCALCIQSAMDIYRIRPSPTHSTSPRPPEACSIADQ